MMTIQKSPRVRGWLHHWLWQVGWTQWRTTSLSTELSLDVDT